MVTAYLHLSNQISMDELKSVFLPEDLVDIKPALSNAYILMSSVLKPLEMQNILLNSLPKDPFIFVNAQRVDFCYWANGDAPQSK